MHVRDAGGSRVGFGFRGVWEGAAELAPQARRGGCDPARRGEGRADFGSRPPTLARGLCFASADCPWECLPDSNVRLLSSQPGLTFRTEAIRKSRGYESGREDLLCAEHVPSYV